MTPIFYDTHAHLDDAVFAEDLPQVIERAQAAGVERIVTVGTNLDSSKRALDGCAQFPGLYAAVGWHPSEAAQAPSDVRPALRQLAAQPGVVALGETGLDFHRLPSKMQHGTAQDDAAYQQRQKELFQQHLEVAAELRLNCIIHQRQALEAVLAQFQPFASRVRAVFHCFVDDIGIARRILELGSLVSFTGIVTFKNAQKVRDTIKALALDQFMLETDCPWLAPVPFRGQRCEPAYIQETARTVAELKGCSMEELSAATCATAQAFFGRSNCWSARL